jgi:hypothetical protein
MVEQTIVRKWTESNWEKADEVHESPDKAFKIIRRRWKASGYEGKKAYWVYANGVYQGRLEATWVEGNSRKEFFIDHLIPATPLTSENDTYGLYIFQLQVCLMCVVQHVQESEKDVEQIVFKGDAVEEDQGNQLKLMDWLHNTHNGALKALKFMLDPYHAGNKKQKERLDVRWYRDPTAALEQGTRLKATAKKKKKNGSQKRKSDSSITTDSSDDDDDDGNTGSDALRRKGKKAPRVHDDDE